MQNTATEVIHNNDSINKTFWRYAIPSVVAMLVSGLYQIVDGIFVGHFIGFQGLAAINITWPIIGLITGFGMLIGMGAGSLLSIFRGEGDNNKAQQTFSNSLLLILLSSLLATVFIYYYGDFFILVQGATNETLSYSLDYLEIFIWGAGFTIAATALPILIRNDDSPNFATGLMTLGAFINIALDYVLIGEMQLGLQGAAIATVIAQIIVVVLGLGYFISKKTSLKISVKNFSLNSCIKIIHLGASGLFMFIYFSFILALHNMLFLQYGSAVHVGAFAIVCYIGTIYYLIAEGIANGVQPPISYYFGANQIEKITATLMLALKIIVISGIVITLWFNLFPDAMISLFNNNDPQLQAETKNGLRLHLFALALDGFIFLASVYFMAVNEGFKALVASLGNIVIQVPFLYFLPLWLGINGIWLTVPVSNVVLTLIVGPMVWHDIRKKQRLGE